jgi:hypothetical protein
MYGKTPPDTPAFQPYWGKLTVRNDRGDRGNVGIIRSPVRASILPDLQPGPAALTDGLNAILSALGRSLSATEGAKVGGSQGIP